MENNPWLVLGADIGGTHITTAIVDLKNRRLVEGTRVRGHLDTNAPVEEVIGSWATIIKQSIGLSGCQISKIGLAMPGPFDYQKGICYIKNQGKYANFYEVNVKERLAKVLLFSADDILLENDAACFLKGEIFFDGEADENLLGITLGTGLGSVISIKHEVTDAGLWCSPFKDGIAEDYLSTRWFLGRYFEWTGIKAKDVKSICETAEKEIVTEVFSEFGKNLKCFLEAQIIKFSPSKIIIGGNIAKASQYFLTYLDELTVPVQIVALGEDSALFGSASSFGL